MNTRRHFLQCLAAAAVLLAVGPVFAASDAPDPDSPEFPAYVLNRVDDIYRGKSSHGVLKMEVKTENFTREMRMESWSRGTEYSLVRILSPKKEYGTATLKAKDDLFTYLNKTGRTIKITGGMLGSSWMGSHFTNDDLVRATRLADDFDIVKSWSGKVAGVAIHVFTLTPKPDAPVVWGKVEIAVRQSDLQPLRQLFYDEEGERVRELQFYDHKEMAGRMMPTKMMMKPLDQPGEYTLVTYESIEFDVKLDSDFFSLQRLAQL
jgi:outer membrane lipoprotein-sorting protein